MLLDALDETEDTAQVQHVLVCERRARAAAGEPFFAQGLGSAEKKAKTGGGKSASKQAPGRTAQATTEERTNALQYSKKKRRIMTMEPTSTWRQAASRSSSLKRQLSRDSNSARHRRRGVGKKGKTVEEAGKVTRMGGSRVRVEEKKKSKTPSVMVSSGLDQSQNPGLFSLARKRTTVL